LVYASSSSVYGANTLIPFSVHHNVDHPLSLYAATKKANELMAHTYSHLYSIPTTGLRFFNVYGPWDRPDMSLQKFAQAIIRGDTIKIFNHGKHTRDFTYIDDIINGIVRVLDRPAQSNLKWSGSEPDPSSSKAPWRIYNIGNNHPVNLMDYINKLEKALGKEANKDFLPLQPGDLPDTWADVEDLAEEFNYRPATGIDVGIEKFVSWFKEYYSV
jgi:UDP-glucuronate 4-epimerase